MIINEILTLKNYHFVLFTMIVFGCSNYENEVPNDSDVIDQTINSVFDYLNEDFDLKGKLLVHHEIYPDNVKKVVIQRVINEFTDQKGHREKLVIGLSKVIDDTVKLALKNNYEYLSFVYKKDSISNLMANLPSNYFGSLNLSKVAYNEEKTIGCYYFALNCGNDCSNGYLIFVKKPEDDTNKWVLEDVINIWGYPRNS